MGQIYQPGDRVEIFNGSYSGKVGTFKKYCSNVFPDHCRVTLDITGRQKVAQTIMIEHRFIKPAEERVTIPLVGLQGSATYNGVPDQKTIDAVNTMAQLAFKNLKK